MKIFLEALFCRPFWKLIDIFACVCPNRSGVGAIDNPDRLEQVFDPYKIYISEAPEKISTSDISMVRPEKIFIFWWFKGIFSISDLEYFIEHA